MNPEGLGVVVLNGHVEDVPWLPHLASWVCCAFLSPRPVPVPLIRVVAPAPSPSLLGLRRLRTEGQQEGIVLLRPTVKHKLAPLHLLLSSYRHHALFQPRVSKGGWVGLRFVLVTKQPWVVFSSPILHGQPMVQGCELT